MLLSRISLLCLLISTMLTGKISAQNTIPAGKNTFVMTFKDSLLCREWKFASSERFGVKHEPEEKEKNNKLIFTADMRVRIFIDGINKSGSWSTDKYKTYITIVLDGSKEKIMYKIISLNERDFQYEYQEPSLIRTIYNYTAVN